MKKKHVIPILTLLLALTACSGQNTQNGTETPPEDRDKTTAETPTQVLTLGPNCTELFVALGLSDIVIGTSLSNHSRGPLPEYEEAYARIPQLTYSSATREAVLTSGADFIYGIDWEFGPEALDIEELNAFGIEVYMNEAATIEDMYQEIADIGAIFGIEDQAQAFIHNQQIRIQKISDTLPPGEPVKVLVYDTGGDGVFTCGKNNLETILIEQAGGKNIFDDIVDRQWTTVSYEAVLERQPDVIVIHDYDAPSLEEKIAAITADPVLSQLDCVQKGRFVPIALESVLPGPRMAYSIEIFANGFYPEIDFGLQ